MTQTSNTNGENPTEKQPLALHIRRWRQWYNKRSITQAELAQLAGISERQVRMYEQCRKLPKTARTLLSIAIAEQLPLERLIAPQLLDEITADVEARRTEMRLTTNLEEDRSWCRLNDR